MQFAKTAEELQILPEKLTYERKKVGRRMNASKTKITTNTIQILIKIQNVNIEYVKGYIYLGKLTAFSGKYDKVINRKIANEWKK